jgi:hypothetical protein
MDYQKMIEKYKSRFITISYIDNGILAFEALALCAFLDHFKIERYIESGIGGGCSISYVSMNFLEMEIIGVDDCSKYGLERFNETKEMLSDNKNITLVNGDSFYTLPEYLNSEKRTAVFIDGPKGKQAVLLSQICLRSEIKFCAVHDFWQDQLDQLMCYDFVTDEKFFNKYKELENKAILQKLKCKHPGLGVLIHG